MAMGITSFLHPRVRCLVRGSACDPRAVQLQTSHLDYNTPCETPGAVTSAGSEVTAFPFLPLQGGRSHFIRALELQKISMSSRMCHPQKQPLLGQRQ